MTIIDEPGMAYIVNDEPRPGLLRSWKVVIRGDMYGVFFTENDTKNGSWTQKFMPYRFQTAEGAKHYLHELLSFSVKKAELIRHGIIPKEEL